MESTYQGNFIRKAVLSAFIALIFISLPAVFSASYAFANTEPVASGKLEGDGTHFKLTNSAYLNITLDSSEPVRVSLESVPETITIHIGQIPDVTFTTLTDITLTGFAPYTTYHKYEDDFHNHEEFVTDADGKYTYVQDITVPHLIFILPRKSTKFINSSGGDCAVIGIWNSSTKTCTLTTNVNETIQIDSNDITLDGNNFTVQGSGSGSGVYLPSGRTGVTVKNLNVRGFSYGIYLYSSGNNTLTGNTASNNYDYGIYLYSSGNNILTNNTASNNYYGIYLSSSGNNTLTNNTANFNNYGIVLYSSGNNTLTGNIAQENNGYDVYIAVESDGHCNNSITNTTGSGGRPIKYFNSAVSLYSETLSELILCNADNSSISNVTIDGSATKKNNGLLAIRADLSTIANVNSSNNNYGIYLYSSGSNTLTNNTASNNSSYGIVLYYSGSNTLTGNTASNNSSYGIYLPFSSNNTLTGNTASSNYNYGIYLHYSSNSRIYNNNFIGNSTPAYVSGGSDNVFNLASPTGGNYWGNFDTPAEGCNNAIMDRFCDAPYVFFGGQDNLPWIAQNGWLDTTPPTTTDNAPSGWQNSDFTIILTCTDDVIGCKETKFRVDGGSWQTGNSIPISIEGDHAIDYYSVDNNGNIESANFTYAKLDKTPPEITINVPVNGGEYILNQIVIADWSAIDALSGLVSSTGTVLSEAAINTASVGVNNFNVTANDYAGNTAAQAITYYVLYAYGGVLQPIKADGSSIFKLGSTVRVKFQLRDASNNFVSSAIARIYLAKIIDSVPDPEIEGTSTSSATTGNLFRYDTTNNQYIFNLGTKGLTTGIWQIRISLDDGSSYYVNISLYK